MIKKIIFSIIDNKIDTLDLSNKIISYNEFKQLLNALRLNKSIKNINLNNFVIYNDNIDDSDYINIIQLILFLKSLENNKLIETLNLSKNRLFFKFTHLFSYFNITDSLNLDFLNILSNEHKEIIQSNFNNINKIIDNYNNIYNVSNLIKYLQRFKSLDLSHNYIKNNSDFLIQLLKNNTTLEKLNISNNKITKSDWTYLLKDNTTLKELSILNDNSHKSYRDISDLDTIDLFVNVIKNGKYLHKLSFWLYGNNQNLNNINENSFKELNNTSIKSLYINGIFYNTKKLKMNFYPLFNSLFNSLKMNTNITELNITGYNITREYKNSLCEMIKNNNTINTLKFKYINMSYNCFKNFIKNLYNKPLINLSLNHIYIKNYNKYTCNEIGELIKNNTSLQCLKVYYIRNKSVNELKYLDLSIDNLKDILKETKTLQKIIFNKYMPISDKDIKEIKEYNKNIEIIKK